MEEIAAARCQHGLKQNGGKALPAAGEDAENAGEQREQRRTARHEPERAAELLLLKDIGGGEHQRDRGDIADAGVEAGKREIAQRRAERTEHPGDPAARLGRRGDAEGSAAVQQRHRRHHQAQQKVQAPADPLGELGPLPRQFPAGQFFAKQRQPHPEFHLCIPPKK